MRAYEVVNLKRNRRKQFESFTLVAIAPQLENLFMKITVRYFGLIAEIVQCTVEDISFEKKTLRELVDVLATKYPALKTKNFKVAQNQELVSLNTLINGTEVALLPPFAGG